MESKETPMDFSDKRSEETASIIGRATRWLCSALCARAAVAALVVWALVASGHIAGAFVDAPDDAWVAIATAAAVLIAALVSSIAGFAFSALAGSALANLGMDPLRAVQSMAVCSIAIQLYGVWKVRDSIHWRSLWPMLAAGAVTIPLGVWLLVRIDGLVYAAGLGAFLVGYGAYTLLRREARVVRGGAWRDAVAGALGGITGGLASFPGAFVTIWCSMRGWDKLRQRAIYQPYILAMQIATIICLRWQSPTRLSVGDDLSLVPFALLGALGGLAVFQRLSSRQFQVAVGMLLAVSGVGLLARAI
jgi:uncharacterized membrane protein YfcA